MVMVRGQVAKGGNRMAYMICILMERVEREYFTCSLLYTYVRSVTVTIPLSDTENQ